jgi:tetratricopeptide (TPR) repeat protein
VEESRSRKSDLLPGPSFRRPSRARIFSDPSVQNTQVCPGQGDFDRGLVQLKRSKELAEKSHNGFLKANCTFQTGWAHQAMGDYEEALRWFGEGAQYAEGAGDKLIMAIVPNLPGGVHLELFDLDEALRINLEAYEKACEFSPWTEPRGHSLTKAGLAYLERGDLALAENFFLRAAELLEDRDEFFRWRWQIVLLRARGELALARGWHEEAWKFASESFDLASTTVSRKHITRAQLLQGEILAASGRLEEAAATLNASARLAEKIRTPREIWMARAALGRVLSKQGKDTEAEQSFVKAVGALQKVASKLSTPRLRKSFVSAELVRDIFKAAGKSVPDLA